jgi:hypothetical protein
LCIHGKYSQENKYIRKENTETWNRKSWLWVLLCTLGIYSTIPLARGFQKLVYSSIGKEFFTYLVFFVIAAVLVILLYIFIFRLKIKSASQYITLIFCAGLYIFFTMQLGGHPEEAIHFLEYGLLSFFVFRALSHRIRDWTIYFTAAFLVMFLGMADEFLQWITPSRVWDYWDVGLNFLGGAIFLFAVWKGIKPSDISGPVRSLSVQVLVSVITLNLLFLVFCLSNTPINVKRYTSSLHFLSWLQQEEQMTEFGHNHNDPEIGKFNSRFTLEEINIIDRTNGNLHGKLISDDMKSGLSIDDISTKYGPDTHPFLYEFIVHHKRRAQNVLAFNDPEDTRNKSELANTVLIENLITEKYFSNTFHHSHLEWNPGDLESLKKSASQWKEEYISSTGRLVTIVDLNSSRAAILITLFITWIGGEIWKRKLSTG